MVETVHRDCVISGGGPAGMVLGLLLARAGLQVTVLEKHADFFRDFRGDTIHPSSITLLGELGLREEFLRLPVNRITAMDVVIDGKRLRLVDFSTLPGTDNFLVLAPQWNFLNFLAGKAAEFAGFDLRMSTTAEHLVIEDRQVRGVRATSPEGLVEIRATLTVAADGRSSVLRGLAGLVPRELGVPIDVLWFGLPKPPDPPPPTLAYVSTHGLVLTLDRGDHYQAGMVVPKGAFDDLQRAGLPALRSRIVGAAGVLAPVVGTLSDWDQVKLLSVQINRLDRWHRPGFMAIGDTAHAMSPMFGVGVNYAVQDAVALANAITGALSRGVAPEASLAAVEQRRQRPVRKMQRVQRLGHARIARAAAGGTLAPDWAVALVDQLAPLIRPAMSRMVGLGFLPEHLTLLPGGCQNA